MASTWPAHTEGHESERAAVIAGFSRRSSTRWLGWNPASRGRVRGGADFSSEVVDPLLQDDGHDHKNASQHVLSTPNIRPLGYNPLTEPGNAEVQVAESPDGRLYAYIAGWTEMHIVDVTDPENTTWISEYYDPNTQVLDVKYLQYDGREYVVLQNHWSTQGRLTRTSGHGRTDPSDGHAGRRDRR